LIISLAALFLFFPLSCVLLGAFTDGGHLTLAFFAMMVQSPYYRSVIENSFNVAILVTVIVSIIAYPLAFAMTRIDLPRKSLIHGLLLLPLIVPPFVGVLGLKRLLGRFGPVNVLLMNVGLTESSIDFLGGGKVTGIIALQVLHLVPIMYLTLCASLAGVHAAMEDAGEMCGATRRRVFFRITLPLTYPGWFAGAVLTFISSFTDLGTPLLFEYRHLLPVQVFNMLSDLHENPVGYSFIVSTCVVCIAAFYGARHALIKGHFAGSGKDARTSKVIHPQPILRWCITSAIILYGCVGLVPHLGVALLGLSATWFMTIFPSQWTLEHVTTVFTHPLPLRSLMISFCLSAVATVVTIIIGYAISWILIRTRPIGHTLVEITALLPLAVPGIVFAFGYLTAFSGTLLDPRRNPFPLLIVAYTTRRLPAAVRSMSAGLESSAVSMEEAARVAGANELTMHRRIVVPLIIRHVIAGAILTFAFSFLEVSDSLILAAEERFFPISKAMYAILARPDGPELASAIGLLVMIFLGACFFFSDRVLRGSRSRQTIVSIGLGLATLFPGWDVLSAQDKELVLVSPHWEGARREFEAGYGRSRVARGLSPVRVRWLDIGGTSDIVRYIRNQFLVHSEGIGVDLMFGGGTDPFVELDQSDLLAPAHIPASIENGLPLEVGGIPLRSSKGTWYAAALSTFGILYNKQVAELQKLTVPKTWRDLADLRYYGWLSAGDPRKSGSLHTIYEIVLQAYGWDEGWKTLEHLARNVKTFTASGAQVGKEIAVGDACFGLAIDTYAGEIIKKEGSDRLGFVIPEDYRTVNGDGIAIIRGAPHIEVAQDFMNFVLSDSGQQLWYRKRGAPAGPRDFELAKLPVRPTTYETGPGASIVTENPFTWQRSFAYDAALGARRWNIVNDLFGAFIIDVHDVLTELQPTELNVDPFPIREEEVLSLTEQGTWNSNQRLRSATLLEWSNSAQVRHNRAGLPEVLRALPGCLLFIFFLIRIAMHTRSAR